MATRQPRKRRADGEEARRRILDAAVEIAAERGYEGTSISLISERSGLPASSIYWAFPDGKSELFAAVIERSFGTWLDAVSLPDATTGDAAARVTAMTQQIAKTLLDAPDFLRLGLMLALERRPEELGARTMFLEVRDTAFAHVADAVRALAPELEPVSVTLLTTYAMAAADGLFIAKEIAGDGVDLLRLFDLHSTALMMLAAHLLDAQRREIP